MNTELFFSEYEETDNLHRIKTQLDITKIYFMKIRRYHVIREFNSYFINDLNEAP